MSASHDVIIVGGGGAGLRAAIAVAEADPRLSIGIVSKVYPMRSHTVSVEAFVAEAPRELLRLEHWGCPWSREPDGQIAVRPFGGMKKKRTWFAADKTGFHLLHTLFQTSQKYPNITRYDEWYASRLITHDGRVCGVVALELMSGLVETITGRSVVTATGGGGRVFPYTTNA